MIETVFIKVKMDAHGSCISKQIVEKSPENSYENIGRLAKIYARMIQNDLVANQEKGGQEELGFQKNKGSRAEFGDNHDFPHSAAT